MPSKTTIVLIVFLLLSVLIFAYLFAVGYFSPRSQSNTIQPSQPSAKSIKLSPKDILRQAEQDILKAEDKSVLSKQERQEILKKNEQDIIKLFKDQSTNYSSSSTSSLNILKNAEQDILKVK